VSSQLEISFDFGNEKFWKYHRENPQIYEAFKKVTLRAIQRGFKHFSAEAVFNVIRWETAVTANEDQFKVNNNFRSYYSRLFCIDYPEHKDFFFRRGSKSDSLLEKAA